MAISLMKGQKISLEKESGSSLDKVIMGLGWDAAPKKKGGFLSGLLGGGSSDGIDLDASCALFDADKKVLDVVYFGQLKSTDGSIVHTGDNRTGDGDGDDEQIIVNLSRVPAKVSSMVFTVNSYAGQTFNEVANAYCRIINAANSSEIARYTLSGGGDHTAMIMAKLYRHNGEWKMHAIGESTSGKTVADLIPGMAAVL